MPNADTVPEPLLTDSGAIDAFLGEQMPEWLKRASVAQLEALARAQREHRELHTRSTRLLHAIQPLEPFARPLLEQALQAEQLDIDVTAATWREVRLEATPVLFPVLETSPPTLRRYNEDSNLLQRALQNFTAAQGGTSGHFEGTGIHAQGTRVALSPARFADLCRTLDLGGRYQRHLDEVLHTTSNGQSLLSLLAAESLTGLALQTQLSFLKGQINDKVYRLLLLVISGNAAIYDGYPVDVCGLQLLDQRVHGALVFEVFDVRPVARYEVRGLVLYLPGDLRKPIREYASWHALMADLLDNLALPDYQAAFLGRFAHDERALVAQALAQKGPIDLKAQSVPVEGKLWPELARLQIARIKADAAALAVPTAMVDAAVYRRRMQAYANAGLTLASVLASFIPGVGQVMLAGMLVQLLDDVYEGAKDWAQGHREEALGHLFGVARNLAATAVLAAGSVAVVEVLKRSRFVDRLVPIFTANGEPRLWSPDLQAYQSGEVPLAAIEGDDGLIRHDGRLWLRQDGRCFEVEWYADAGHWRICHPHRPEAYRPPLEHNGEAAWRLPGEHPLQWQGIASMVRRCGPWSRELSDTDCEQVARIAGIEEDQLRGLFVENRRLPASLRDVLEQLQLDARISRFLARLRVAQTSAGLDTELYGHSRALLDLVEDDAAALDRLKAQADALGGQLFGYMLRLREPQPSSTEELLTRFFPGLPTGYARTLVEQADTDQVQFMAQHQRLPLALAERAREMLREIRLTRALLGLKLRNGFYEDSARLALALLRRTPGWPAGLSLEIREGSPFGRLIERQLALSDTRDVRVIVHRQGRFEVYSEDGYASDEEVPEPAGLFEAVWACLSPQQRSGLGVEGEQGAPRLQQDLLAQALSERERCGPLFGLARARPLLNRWHRLPDGRVGYPLSGRGPAGRESLTEIVRTLFPCFDEGRINAFLADLRATHSNVMRALLDYRLQWHRLEMHLVCWEMGASPTPVRIRRRFAEALRQCWRREGEQIVARSGVLLGNSLHLVNVPLADFPALPENVNFDHVVNINLSGTPIGMSVNPFLRSFSRVRWLDLGHCRLTDIPPAVSRMHGLRDLYLDNNQIQLSAAGTQHLLSLSQLEILDLSLNPVGAHLNLAGLTSLRGLFLRNTQLAELPPGLLDLPRLEMVDLRENQITELPERFFAAPNERMAISLHGNPLTPATLTRLQNLHRALAEARLHVSLDEARQLWLEGMEAPLQATRVPLWSQLQEQGGGDFLRLLADLTETAEFHSARVDLTARVWQMVEAVHENTQLRQELFDLVAHPTTCVDSVISTFSTLEVRLQLYQALARASGEDAQRVLLDFSRQLFRLEQVEQLARTEIARRRVFGLDVDEVEVSLAYRIGLARELHLPGQPGHMQFGALAEVSAQQLRDAARSVQAAEASEQLEQFVSDRYFWRDHLREVHAARFESVEAQFWQRLEQLEGQQAELPEGDYLQQMNQLSSERDATLDALALTLTREALRAHATSR
ncbi:hypothetical protein DCO48_01535 [Pseudomonas sp. SDI]|uniref:NEL-type E3 ubiquitin ligase domain-containing protein n=1 Tax=Pseudomonas sp. SDI TaxID=2170734 RepID=UPI000DE792FC|nr:NEL-type E3 ubiquitin ligase domain-containing protein [Pseudomonas sp. SDI]PWB35599.1 hypothetical protein DCO48_01535 [Pseudomonas sp. SDI]